MQADPNFWKLNLGHLIEMGAFIVAYLTYRNDRKKDAQDRSEARDKMIQTQTQMHAQNSQKLETVTEFTEEQKRINILRDQQIASIREQTAALLEIGRGLDRRMRLMERMNGGDQ